MDGTQQPPPAPVGVSTQSTLGRQRVLLAAALVVIFSLALGLRLYGVNWDRGYDWTPHPDERAIFMKVDALSPPALGELGLLLDVDDSPLNPRWFNYGSFPLYLLKGVQLIYTAWPGAELRDLRLAGRTISALADVGTVLLVYLLGSRLYGRREALLASALLALAVIHIQLSHFYAVDTQLVLIAIVALYFMHRVATLGRLRDSVLAGAFIGLGLATKASLTPIYIAFVMAHLLFFLGVVEGGRGLDLRSGDRWLAALKGLAVGAAASVLVFGVAQPYAFLDWARFLGDFNEQSEMVRRIRDYPYTRQYIDTTPYWYHVRQLATWGLGWPLGVVAWAGLLYVSLRGMRFRHGLAYLGLGWGLPMAVLLYSNSIVAILLASGIAFAALVGTLPARSTQSRMEVLLLSWVVPYLLITGALEVKFLRYLLPITPILILWGSRMLFALWDRAPRHGPTLRPWLASGLLLLVGATGFYALSYVSLYGEPHTGVRISRWINSNAEQGAVILMEHWEEGLPDMGRYEVRRLPLYDNDDSGKLRRLARDLADADLLVFFSNRLYGTIPRLPERYPITSAYYRLLFSGELGYELADVETAYPRLARVSLADDTLGRPGLPTPSGITSFQPSGLTVNLGFADESFSVYDHPVGLVFKNVARLDTATIRQAIIDSAPPEALRPRSRRAASIGLLLSPEEAEAQREGGTWSEIVRPDSWTNQLPVVAWLLLIEGVALLALPVTLVIFRPLADRGYLFSKPLGLLAVVMVAWLLASLHWMAFSRASIGLALLVLAGVSTVVLVKNRQEITEFVRRQWNVLLIGEIIFLAAFFSFVVVRMANPDLWHPFRGGEKPMELAYLTAVLKSSYMPPFDPWFGGGYLNYYYLGQFMVATLIRATGIEPAVAFNLAVALFFALTVAGAYTIVYNLAEGTRRRLQTSMTGAHGTLAVSDDASLIETPPDQLGESPSNQGRTEGEPDREPDISVRPRPVEGPKEPGGMPWSSVVAGIGGALFVTVLGNLDGAIQVVQGAWRVLVRSAPFGEFDFWRSSRMMPPDPPGHEITEFPFFTFLFADLHPHLMALPFTLLALGLALAVVLGAARNSGPRGTPLGGLAQGGWGVREMARLATLGVVVGSLLLINAWDFPTYMIVAVAAVFLAGYLRNGGLSLFVLLETGVKAALVMLVAYLAFRPFHLANEAFFTSLESTTNQTVLWQFLGITGLFVFIIGSFFISELRDWLVAWRRMRARAFSPGLAGPVPAVDRGLIGTLRVSVVALVTVVGGYILYTAVSGWLGSTIPFLLALEALALVLGLRFLISSRVDAPQLTFVTVIIGVSLGLAIGLDIYRVEGDIDRMNSVFKFYLQIWVMLALASAYLLWRLAHGRRVPLIHLSWAKKAWLGALIALIMSASVYTVMGTQDRLRDRFNGQVLPMTLDGTAYIQGAVYHDRKGDIDLATDFEGIRWLQEQVRGSPIILEGNTPTYRWGGRISVYTGLPSVVGWRWHQEQQRWDYRWAVGQRIDDVNRIYSTTDASEAMSLMRKYGVEYVYVGQLESLYYPGAGLEKFDDMVGEQLDQVYRNKHVRVYRLRQG